MAGGSFFSQYTVTFEKDEIIYEQSAIGNCMFVIKDGDVLLTKEAGEKTEAMGQMGKGDFFGELSILEHSPRAETAKAVNDCTVVVIHRSTFVRMLKSNMEIAIRIMQKLSTKLLQAEEKTDSLLKRLAVLESKSHLTQPNIPLTTEKKVVGKMISMTTNRVFILNSDRNLVGRYDPVTGIKPEVDLTYEDDTRSVSRRHAIIFRRNNQFFVQEEIGVLNGTFVNGTKASSNSELIPIADQDMVNIGMLAFKFFILTEDEV